MKRIETNPSVTADEIMTPLRLPDFQMTILKDASTNNRYSAIDLVSRPVKPVEMNRHPIKIEYRNSGPVIFGRSTDVEVFLDQENLIRIVRCCKNMRIGEITPMSIRYPSYSDKDLCFLSMLSPVLAATMPIPTHFNIKRSLNICADVNNREGKTSTKMKPAIQEIPIRPNNIVMNSTFSLPIICFRVQKYKETPSVRMNSIVNP